VTAAAVVAVPLITASVYVVPRWRSYFSNVDTSYPTSVPSCKWPLQIFDKPTHDEAGLMRCYVSAVARRDLPALSKVFTGVRNTLPTMHASDVRQSADALSGTASAHFIENGVTSTLLHVTLRYADGAQAEIDLGWANYTTEHSWRITSVSFEPKPA
jgi:hypothetical protein